MSETIRGYWCAIAAFTLWGLFPVYFKLLATVDPWLIVACRVVFSFLLLLFILKIIDHFDGFLKVLAQLKSNAYLIFTSVLIVANWGLYVWAVINDKVLDASLAYFINPLLNILLGYVFLSERLKPIQWLAVVLAVVGVAIQTLSFGQVPWVALGLAFAFAIYGLVHKKHSVSSATGLTVETFLIFPMALGFLLLNSFQTPSESALTLAQWSLLLLGGPFTVLPLLLFTMAAKRISLTSLGFIQYIAPTILFGLGVLVYKEPVSVVKLLTFGCIWSGLFLISLDTLLKKN